MIEENVKSENIPVSINSDYLSEEEMKIIRKLEVPKLKRITKSIFEEKEEK